MHVAASGWMYVLAFVLFAVLVGVISLAFRGKAGAAAAAPAARAGYHVPSEILVQQKRGRETHWMYDQPRR